MDCTICFGRSFTLPWYRAKIERQGDCRCFESAPLLATAKKRRPEAQHSPYLIGGDPPNRLDSAEAVAIKFQRTATQTRAYGPTGDGFRLEFFPVKVLDIRSGALRFRK